MPATLTTPGVYVQELPSGSRSITGVSTSLTAFVGPAPRGPVDDPTTVTSWAEYERVFGGLSPDSTMSQSVRHYFQNGGAEALVVRVVNGEQLLLTATAAAAAVAGFDRLRATITPGAGTQFDLRVDLLDSAGVVLDDGTAYTATVALDTAAPDLAAIDALATGHVAPVSLVVATGDFPAQVPAAGAVESTAHDPTRLVLGAGATGATGALDIGLRLAVTPEALGVAGFDHATVTVANRDEAAGTFDLTVALANAGGTVLDDGTDPYSVSLIGLDVADDYAALIDAATTATSPALRPVAVVGAAPTSVPQDGATRSAAHGDGHVVTLATERVVLAAASPGEWGNRVQVSALYEDALADCFHLRLAEVQADGMVAAEEVFYNLATDPLAAACVDRVLAERSQLARVLSTAALVDLPGAPAPTVTLAGGADGAAPRITEDVQGTGRAGVHALEVHAFNMLCIPLDSWSTSNAGELALWSDAISFCNQHRAIALVDPPSDWTSAATAVDGANVLTLRDQNAAMYFPRVRIPDPLVGRVAEFPPCGVVAGAIARTDSQRGIWKAPAGIDVTLLGVPELALSLTDAQQGDLNQLGINCLRSFPVYGRVIWGARTLRGADVLGSEWKYLPVRRLALHIEESLRRGTQWAVFEGNAEPLWAQLRLTVGAFLHQLFRQGAFQGASAKDAYFVKCDAETTTPSDRERGIVNVLVGFAPLKPAEFVIIKLQQIADRS